MKLYLIPFCILPLFSIQSNFLPEATASNFENTSTGIILDSMQNEVFLASQNGSPKFYYSNIFTPVCNTGQCLPVYINIYWNLAGKFVRFDFPEGEILTKLDHVPFSPEDYILLNEILKGPDPRLSIPTLDSHISQGAKHNQGEQGNQSNPSSPTPNSIQSTKRVSKYEMVDGVTGATAIQHTAKFVPGALYTTYTLWGLANDSEAKILAYTKEKIFVDKNICSFLTDVTAGCQNEMIKHYTLVDNSINARANFLMSIVDTTNNNTAIVAINWIYFNEFFLDTVSNTLNRRFYGESNETLKLGILQTWAYNFASDLTLLTLSEKLADYNSIFSNALLVFSNKVSWPVGTVTNLLNQFQKLTAENRQLLYDLMIQKKDWLTNNELDLLADKKKKYNL